ncbi:MAG: single-stranded-DNA-specific exonuclease RecJ [Deltaproteobacteria bacterium]|nr:single-stranded-DNA-specific exonuclease RecJ [Deltaproteobacteria bacterium]
MKEWRIKPVLPAEQKNLEEHLDISPLLARLLINRGYADPDSTRRYLTGSLKDLPNPFLLKGMNEAVDRLIRAIRQKEKIVVYGDYDVDGTCGTSLLLLFFKSLGNPVSFYVPHRMKEGYSLNTGALKKLKGEGIDVVITVDNGITANQEAEAARDLGIDVIVTDHHECPDELPRAYAVINPHRPDCPYPAKEICGTAVAFNLALALRMRLREEGFFGASLSEPNMKQFLDLVALATVADVVPLTGANRIFVKIGLEELNRSTRPGIVALKEAAGCGKTLSTADLGFRLGPRLNACGRLYDASKGVGLLTSENSGEARRLAQELNSANAERQGVEKQILREAIALLEADKETQQRMGHVLFQEEWHPGVIGIVASRLAEKYSRPVVMLGRDSFGADIPRLKGSARSFGGLNLIETLRACREHLIKCGGHKAAAGLTLLPERLENFKRAFDSAVRERADPEDFRPFLTLDAELRLEEIDSRLLTEVEKLKPFGVGNPAPLFCLRAVTPRFPRIVGERHLKFTAGRAGTAGGNGQPAGPPPVAGPNLNAIAFGMADLSHLLQNAVDLAFACELNEFNGVSSLVLNVKDIHPQTVQETFHASHG